MLEFSSLPLPAHAGHSLGPLEDFGEDLKYCFGRGTPSRCPLIELKSKFSTIFALPG